MGTISGTAGPDTLNGTAGDDTILGQGGNDTLNANGGHDILTGGAGSDTLNGGSDNVIYQDTVANFDGDHITNFKMGDAIQITDLDLAHGTVGLVGGLVTYSYNDGANSGAITIDNLAGGVGPGRLVLRLSGATGIELRLQQDAHNDLSGDGSSEILARPKRPVQHLELGRSPPSVHHVLCEQHCGQQLAY